jgi:hypothetical protein
MPARPIHISLEASANSALVDTKVCAVTEVLVDGSGLCGRAEIWL